MPRRIFFKENSLPSIVPNGYQVLGLTESKLYIQDSINITQVDSYLVSATLSGTDLILQSNGLGFSGSVSLGSIVSLGTTGATGNDGPIGPTGATGPNITSSQSNNQIILGSDGYLWMGSLTASSIVIAFTNSTIYNSSTSPGTSSITENLTGAKIGIVQKIYHQWTTAPSFPVNWTKLGTGVYSTASMNRIYAEWVGGTSSEYWIVQ